jgi:quinol monooxygenase YgiN
MGRCCPIVELRQYTLHPGQRDTLIDLFDREFVESQEAVGIRVIGQFRDLDDPDRFVWLRGFPDPDARRRALAAFYDGPVWRAHRAAANRTMIDSDNVLLLRPVGPEGGFALPERPHGSGEGGVVTATIHYLDPGAHDAFASFFESAVRPAIAAAGGSVAATLATEPGPNGYPRLPVREGERVFAWFSAHPDLAALERHRAAFRAAAGGWRRAAPAAVLRQLARKPETLTLAPTARSLLRWSPAGGGGGLSLPA